MNLYSFNPELGPSFLGHGGTDLNEMANLDPFLLANNSDLGATYLPTLLDDSDVPSVNLGCQNQLELPLGLDNVDPVEVPDVPDTCFNYISNLLTEEYSDYHRFGSTLQDYMVAQVSYNKSLDAALLGENCSTFYANQCPPTLCRNSCVDNYINSGISYANPANVNTNFVENSLVGNSGSSILNSNLELGSDGLLGPQVAGPTAPVPAIPGGSAAHQYGQGFHLMSSWDSLSNRKSNNQSNQVVRLEEQERGNNLVDIHQWGDMNMYTNTQINPGPVTHTGIQPSNCLNRSAQDLTRMLSSGTPVYGNAEIAQGFVQGSESLDKNRGRKHGEVDVEENGEETERRSKHSAPSNEVFEQIEQYGDVLLCPEGRSKPAGLCSSLNKMSISQNSEDLKLRKDGASASKGPKKRGNKKQVVDLKSLLSRCAQCVARVDLTGAYEMLKQIRQHSSPYGDCLQRVAHYLANGLEARLEGKGLELTLANEQIAACEVLKANRVYVASVPFKIMSYYTTNKTIASLVEVAPSIHIIDFGIFYGLQWPCIIQNLSRRPNGPPRIRITGIDFPQRGFRPAERVEETGRCLAKYCERYNVPFEYHAIAKKWETIQLDDLKIERNEPLVVNCLYRSHNLFDESVEEHSPRDAFLNLVRKINPDIFMHGIVNSTSSVPFFLNRFKEAMFHYTSLFDLFEATMSREDNERLLLESKLYGNQALNVIACESIERFERPESYKQWQVRTLRAGLVQVPLDRELLRRARAMVKRNFRPEFSYDEDGHWVVQGWKGRILYAISCWKPHEV